MPTADWPPPPPDLTLPDNQVHLWRASLELPTSCAQSLESSLTPDERQRADRFHFDKDRRHFIVARGVLRDILSRYLATEPGQLRFRYSDYGKPALMLTPGQPELTFNLSHSYTLALYAIAHRRQIGIDLEYIRPLADIERIAGRFFSNRENDTFQALPQSQKLEGFFNCWTRKEAYIKARGEGLSLPLNRFDVSLRPGEPAALLEVRDEPAEMARWSLQAVRPGSNYAAALVVEGEDWQLKCWQWSHKESQS